MQHTCNNSWQRPLDHSYLFKSYYQVGQWAIWTLPQPWLCRFWRKTNPCPSLKSCQKLEKVLIKFDVWITWTQVLWIRYLAALHFASIFPICFLSIFQKKKSKISLWVLICLKDCFGQSKKLRLNPFLNNVSFLKLIKGEEPYTKPLEQQVNTFVCITE